MSWKQLLAKGEVKAHRTSKQELDNIRALVARDMADASLPGLSAAANSLLLITRLSRQGK